MSSDPNNTFRSQMLQAQLDLQKDIRKKLTEVKSDSFVPVIMPECSDLYLSQINGDYNIQNTGVPTTFDLFKEYFRRFTTKDCNPAQSVDDEGIHHRFYLGLANPREELVQFFKNNCETLPDKESPWIQSPESPSSEFTKKYPFNPYCMEEVGNLSCCIPCSCLNLWGDRRIKQIGAKDKDEGELLPTDRRITRLFIGDVIWLFFFERMGIFKIIGGILDDYANGGHYPMPNNKITSLILEMMIRDVKKGTASTIKDRAYTYAKCLGWKLTTQPTEIDAHKININKGFTATFHKFIKVSLRYFKEKRLAEAISQTQLTPPSAATMIAIQDTVSLLRSSMDAFNLGRNYYNTLNGIIWIIAGIDLISQFRDSFGIPLSYKNLDQIIPAAYNVIVDKKTINTSNTNRFKLHYECAHDARDILIDIAGSAINFDNPTDLGVWLSLIESRVEGYRIAYLELTGVDLGGDTEPIIEQQI